MNAKMCKVIRRIAKSIGKANGYPDRKYQSVKTKAITFIDDTQLDAEGNTVKKERKFYRHKTVLAADCTRYQYKKLKRKVKEKMRHAH